MSTGGGSYDITKRKSFAGTSWGERTGGSRDPRDFAPGTGAALGLAQAQTAKQKKTLLGAAPAAPTASSAPAAQAGAAPTDPNAPTVARRLFGVK
jgi:hypothetical protein